ncbi:helix-turn-helix domain-containing protein [Enterobacter cloacae complex sp. 2025EL-00064]|uniref:helix-turn-helix domain-containing protein n=1 Tax=Enterobacter cloacae complex sp. 2025EL-00064 TaxID=3415635 RepID=UPI003C796D82
MNSETYGQKTDNVAKNHERFLLRSGINRFSERLKEAMEAANIASNVQLARQTELSESTIRKYLKGETYPTLDRLALLAEACSCSASWLATGEGDTRLQINDAAESLVYKCERVGPEVDKILSYLSPEQQDKFLKVIYTRGIGAILRLDDDLDSQFLALSEDEKARLMRLNEQVKKGASVDSDKGEVTNPAPTGTGRL